MNPVPHSLRLRKPLARLVISTRFFLAQPQTFGILESPSLPPRGSSVAWGVVALLYVFGVGCGLGASFIPAFSKFMKPFHPAPPGMALTACLFACECGELRPCFCGGGLLWLLGEGRGREGGGT